MRGEMGTKAFIAEENGKETLCKFDNIDNFFKILFSAGILWWTASLHNEVFYRY